MRIFISVLKGVTEAFGGLLNLPGKSYDSLCNDKNGRVSKGNCQGYYRRREYKGTGKPRTIVEDFAYYLQEVPGAFMFLGTGNEEKIHVILVQFSI